MQLLKSNKAVFYEIFSFLQVCIISKKIIHIKLMLKWNF